MEIKLHTYNFMLITISPTPSRLSLLCCQLH